MKCKRCGSKKDVVKYGQGLTYRGAELPAGQVCHDCMRAYREAVDIALGEGAVGEPINCDGMGDEEFYPDSGIF